MLGAGDDRMMTSGDLSIAANFIVSSVSKSYVA